MLKWYKFQHGLNLIRPLAVCFGQAPLPGVPGAPGVPPVSGLTRVTRVRLSYSLYKVCTFLSCVFVFFFAFVGPHWSCVRLTSYFGGACRVLRDLFRNSTILHGVSYVWKIKFARRIQRISEVFLNSSVINKISVRRVDRWRLWASGGGCAVVCCRTSITEVDVRRSTLALRLKFGSTCQCLPSFRTSTRPAVIGRPVLLGCCKSCLRQSTGASSFRLSSLVYHGRPVFWGRCARCGFRRGGGVGGGFCLAARACE